jgi:hypothetical protein
MKKCACFQVTMHHLSSDGELTILKVGPKGDDIDQDKTIDNGVDLSDSDTNEIETEINHRIDEDDEDESVFHDGSDDDADDVDEDGTDAKADRTKYIVLQKLPNGGAIDLENMQTYTMEDFASDLKQHGGGDKNVTIERPRSFKKSLDFGNATDDDDETTVVPYSDFLLPDELVISERPPAQPEVYEPVPLSQLDDLEAMPATQDDHPVYIIYEKDLFQRQEEQEIAENLANLELLKLSSNVTVSAEAAGNKTSDQGSILRNSISAEYFLNLFSS